MEESYLFIIFPPLIGLLLTLRMNHDGYTKPWFQPHKYVFVIVWTLIYVKLGYLLHKTYSDEHEHVFWGIIAFILVSYAWLLLYRFKMFKTGLMMIVTMLFTAFYVYTELLKSSISAFHVHLFGASFSWIIFALVLASHSMPVTEV